MKKLLSVLLSAMLLVSGMALFAACTPNEPAPVRTTLKIVGDVQELYGGENGWPQAVLVAKKDFIAENAEFVEDFIAAMQANEDWLAAEDTQPQAIVDAITDHLGGANPTFNAKNLTKEVIANCAIRFEAAADCKEEVNAFLQSLTAVGAQGLSVSDDFYYKPGSDDPGSAAAEVVADIYAPDGAPALSLAQLMSEDMQFGEGNTVTYNVVAASSIQTYVTGEEPQAELCVLPVNAAAKLLGKGDVYQMLGTVTHGNIYVLSAASKGYADLTSANLKEQLLGKTVGCIQLDNVVGLTLKVVLDNSDIPFEVIEDVSEATADDVVYLLNISDPATMITPAAPYDYMVAAEPVVSTKVGASEGKLKNVGDLQALYGGKNGWPQAVLVAKKDFIAENTEFVEDFIAAMQANEGWLAAEDTQPQAIVDAITDHLGGANPTFNAKNLTKEVIANCAIRFDAAADCKEEVNAFLESLSAVSGQSFSMADAFFYQG